MQRWIKHIALGLMPLALAGCMENTALVKVNKDGSGMLVVQEFLSPQITQMMEGVGNAMGEALGGIAGETAEGEAPKPAPKPAADPLSLFKDSIEKKLAMLGEGAKLVSSQAKTNAAGWKGYTATYSFKDINAVSVALSDDEKKDSDNGMPVDTGVKFQFTPGDVAELNIIPVKKAAEAAPAEPEAPAEDPAMMMQMMGPMLKGMRMALFVQVDGEIVETNARHVKKPNIVTVMDMPMDKLLANPEAAKLMGKKGPEVTAKLIELQIPGVLLEDEGKTIGIKFK